MKRLLYLIILLSLFSLNAMAQCASVSFTYTEGTNGSVSFTSNVTGGSAPYKYRWNINTDSVTSTEANPVFIFPANYTYNVCLTISNVSGCADSTFCLPVVVTTSQTPACSGTASFTVDQSASLTNFNYSGPITFRTINYGDNSYGDQCHCNQFQHQYKLNGSYTVTSYTYSVFNSFVIPCDTFTQTVNITNVPCHADFYIVGDTVHPGGIDHFDLINNSTGGNRNRWYINGTLAYVDTNYVFTQQLPPGMYNICLVVYGQNGCSDSICKVDSLTYTPICSGLSFDYTALSSPCNAYQFTTTNTGSALASIEWDTDNSIASTLENPVITLDFSSAQNDVKSISINVKATGGGCSASQTFTFNNPAGFTVYNGDSTSSTHVWHVYPVFADIASQTWDFGDGTTSTEPYPTHTYASEGIYNLCHEVTLTNGCSYNYCYSQYFFRQEQGNAVVQIVVESATGVKNVAELTKINFYPNPVTGSFSVETEQALTNAYLTIYNTISQPVKTVPVSVGGKLFTSNIKQLAAGIYYYQIAEKGVSIYRGKFVVAK